MHDFTRLRAWQRARQLAVAVYRVSDLWPDSERFGLVGQARRAAVSVPSNIAEGAGRGSEREFGRFVRISMGSLCELETLLLLAEDLDYPGATAAREVISECIEVRRMLYQLAGRPPVPARDAKERPADC
ncbi:MAG TPA: four helix bundle protein [Acidimicrobiia bacterium]|jgi:four helix bundle protein